MERFVIGIDYGTQSARAQVVAMKDGRALGEAVYAYPHGVISQCLADGTPLLGGDWALADPQDYWTALITLVPQAMAAAGISPQSVAGLSIAATACTLLPVDKHLTPLCLLPEFKSESHAYVKLWKHHRAEPDARRLSSAAQAWGGDMLAAYGGAVSSEWALPKMMEVRREAPRVYAAAAYFMQFSDWLDSRLTGNLVRNGGIASFKALHDRERGYPDRDFLAHVDTALIEMVEEKLRGRIVWPGELAGRLTPEAARTLGLLPGTAVGSGHSDAHGAALGSGVCRGGDYLCVLGTSSVTHFLNEKHCLVPGISGVIRDGLLPGLTCYTAGQPCVGDMLEWFVRLIAPEGGQKAYQELADKASALEPGANGLVALDWWNGSRSILSNSNLSGLMVGLTMNTRPWEIYRALVESAAFGQRMIRDQYAASGLEIRRYIICGGIARKSALMCQILADVLGVPLEVAGTDQATALGAAMCAAAAAGPRAGGYETLAEAVEQMKSTPSQTVEPVPRHTAAYGELFEIFTHLHQSFGVEAPWLMERLRQLRK